MARWQPDARGRLQEAAMTLYAERGYDETTIADIAERAGLTKRTFFRYFADKRDVIFYGSDIFRERFVSAVSAAPPAASAMTAVSAGLDAIAEMMDLERGREFAGLRHRIVSATPELQERELIKLSSVAADGAAALELRGVSPLTASLAAETAMMVVKVAFPRWIEDESRTLAQVMEEAVQELRAATV